MIIDVSTVCFWLSEKVEIYRCVIKNKLVFERFISSFWILEFIIIGRSVKIIKEQKNRGYKIKAQRKEKEKRKQNRTGCRFKLLLHYLRFSNLVQILRRSHFILFLLNSVSFKLRWLFFFTRLLTFITL